MRSQVDPFTLILWENIFFILGVYEISICDRAFVFNFIMFELEFDVVIGINWSTHFCVVINYEISRVSMVTVDGVSVCY